MSSLKSDLKNTAAHSSIGPSSADRWMNCTASVPFIKKCGKDSEESGEEAARGTVAHHYGALCLLNGQEAWEFAGEVRKEGEYEFEVDDDMVASIQKYVDTVLGLMAYYADKGAMLYVERRVWSDQDDEMFGTSDTIIEVPGDRIIIVDFKNGMVIVEPDKEQLKLYGEYAYERRTDAMRGEGEPSVIQLIIVQPRMPHPKGVVRSFLTNPEELINWVATKVVPKVHETRSPEAKFVLGPWCKYCPALAFCAKARDTISAIPDGPVHILTNEQIAKSRKLKKISAKFFEALEKEAFTRVKEGGQEIDGCKLVHKQGSRVARPSMTVTNPETGEDTVLKFEDAAKAVFGDKLYDKPKMKTIPQLEKLPGGAAFAAQWGFKPDTGLTLADEDDTREVAVGLMALADKAAAATNDVPV
jgi:hypothetical protein